MHPARNNRPKVLETYRSFLLNDRIGYIYYNAARHSLSTETGGSAPGGDARGKATLQLACKARRRRRRTPAQRILPPRSSLAYRWVQLDRAHRPRACAALRRPVR